jgi:predicted dehydrogenase
MNKKFKVAVIGCGTIAKTHLISLSLIPNCEVTALCDTVGERAEKYASEFSKTAKIYTSYIEMLENEELDAVHICTPHYLHSKMTIDALNRGVNVFLEKPLCISLSEIDEMIEAERKSSARASVCFQNRLNDSFLYAKNIVENSDEKFNAYATVFWYRSKEYYEADEWRGKWATEGGGVMINQAIHTIDLMISLLGNPKSVTATISNHHLKDTIEVEDSSEGVIEFENGSVGNFYVTNAAPVGDRITLVLNSKSTKIEIRGQDISVNGKSIDFPKTISYLDKEYYGSRHPDIIKNFYEALSTGADMPVSLKSASKVIKVILAAYKSHDKKIII